MSSSYFEDLQLGHSELFGKYIAEEQEMLAFAHKWDPQAIHIDSAAATPLFGSVIAPMSYTMAIAGRFISQRPQPLALIAGLGSDGFELPQPLRPGDIVSNELQWTALRASSSKTDRGIAHMTQTLRNQHGEIVLLTRGRMMIARRPQR